MALYTWIFITLFIFKNNSIVQAWTSEELELFDLVDDINQNFYEVLSLDQTASVAEIKKAYRRLSLQYHPDKNKKPGAEEQFRKIVAVSEVLKDEERRKQYDLILQNGLPDWKQPIFYYRRVRKMGLFELFIFLSVLLTAGHFILLWATYWERKYELEEVLNARVKKKKSKKCKIPETASDELIASQISLIPKPAINDLLPVLIVKSLANFFLHLPSQISSWKDRYRNLQEFEEESSDEDGTEEKVKKPRKKIKTEIPDFYSLVPTCMNGLTTENNNESPLQYSGMEVTKPREWSEHDVVLLAKAMSRYPGGTTDRWGKVAASLGRTVEEVSAKVKTLKSSMSATYSCTALQGLTGNEATSLIGEADLTYEVRDFQSEVTLRRTKQSKEVEGELKLTDADTSWSQTQQKSLEVALQKFPKGCEDRWDWIASQVEGKSKEDCLLRYKTLVELIKKRKSHAV